MFQLEIQVSPFYLLVAIPAHCNTSLEVVWWEMLLSHHMGHGGKENQEFKDNLGYLMSLKSS